MARMEAEAHALGADGVIGVQLRSLNYMFASDVLEFVCMGTAVKATDGSSYRTPAGRPFTSALSGQDFWTLWHHGWGPRSLVLGTCVYHIAHMSFRQMCPTSGTQPPTSGTAVSRLRSTSKATCGVDTSPITGYRRKSPQAGHTAGPP